jgi:ribokinase
VTVDPVPSPDLPDILVIGDLNPDLILTGDDLQPRFGQVEQLADRADLVVGGSGAIVACGASRLGLAASLCAVVGDDAFGSIMARAIAELGVDPSSVRIDPTLKTGVSVILTSASGRAILTAPGAIEGLSPDDVQGLATPPARHVHVSSLFLMAPGLRAALPDLLDRFARAGCTSSLDPNWDPSERWDLGGLDDVVDLIFPNREELLAITGAPTVAEAIASWERRAGLVVTLGKAGAMCRIQARDEHVRAPERPGLADTIGAGDSFVAGFLASWIQGGSPIESLALAVAAGSLSTRAVGGTAGQPDRREADALSATLSRSP